MAQSWEDAETVEAPTSNWQDAEVVAQKLQAEMASEGLQNLTPTLMDSGETAVGLGELAVNTTGKAAAMAGAGITGVVDALRPDNFIMPDPESKGFNMRVEGNPDNMDRAANTVNTMMGEANEAFQPITEGGERVQETAGVGLEAVGKGIKYPLSAVPFIAAENLEGGNTGTEEREKFMEMPMSKYLGELAEDLGAGPIGATIAHMAPDAVLTALGYNLGKAGVAAKGKPVRGPVPTVESLKADSRVLYQAVDDAGIRISQEAFEGAVGQLVDDFAKAGGRQSLTPKTYAAIQELRAEAAAGGITIAKAEELRRVLGKARSGIEEADRASANAAIHALDDFMENLKPNQLRQSLGDANASGVIGKEGVEYISAARSLWGRARKTELMEEMIEAASIRAKGRYHGAGFENSMRMEFTNLAVRLAKNKKLRAQYTAAEIAAIKQVAKGTPIQNVLRWVGKAAPTGVISAGGGMSAGMYLLGPVGAVAVPAVGSLARFAATRMGMQNAKGLSDLMARGQ
jgi:hypothetical protein